MCETLADKMRTNMPKTSVQQFGQAGFTMAEFMVGMTLSGLSLGMLVSVQIRMQQSMQQQQESAKALKSSNTALQMMGRVVQEAGVGFPVAGINKSIDPTTNITLGDFKAPAVRMNNFTGGENNNIKFGRSWARTNNDVNKPMVPIVYPIEVDNETPFDKSHQSWGSPDLIVVNRATGPVAYVDTAASWYPSGPNLTLTLSRNAVEFAEPGTGPQLLLLTNENNKGDLTDDVSCVLAGVISTTNVSQILFPYFSGTSGPNAANAGGYSLCSGVAYMPNVKVQRFASTAFGISATIDECVITRGQVMGIGKLKRIDLTVDGEGNFVAGANQTTILGEGYSNLQIAVRARTAGATFDWDGDGDTNLNWYSGTNLSELKVDAAISRKHTIQYWTVAPPSPPTISLEMGSGPSPLFDFSVVQEVSLSLETRQFKRIEGNLAGCTLEAGQLAAPAIFTEPLGYCGDSATTTSAYMPFNAIGDSSVWNADHNRCTGVTFGAGGYPSLSTVLYFADATYSTTRLRVTLENAPR